MSKAGYRNDRLYQDLMRDDQKKVGTIRHKKAERKYSSSILTEAGWMSKSLDYSTTANCPAIDKKHVRRFNSGVVRAGVASVIKNMPAHLFWVDRWAGAYPRLNWCWSNSRYYIAFNDIEHPSSTYFYEEGWFLATKMVDGEYRNLQLLHHGRVKVRTASGAEHIVDLTYKDAIPVMVDSVKVTQAGERALILAGKDSKVHLEEQTKAIFVARESKVFFRNLKNLKVRGRLKGKLYGEAVEAVRDCIAFTRLPHRRIYQAPPWCDVEAVRKTPNEIRSRRNRQSRSRLRSKRSSSSRRRNRKAA